MQDREWRFLLTDKSGGFRAGDLVSPFQILGKAEGSGSDAPDQRNVPVFGLFVGQLKAGFPIADGLASAQGVNLLLGRNTRCVLGGASL